MNKWLLQYIELTKIINDDNYSGLLRCVDETNYSNKSPNYIGIDM